MRFPNYKVLLFALFLLVVACGRSYEEQRRMSRAERYRLFREDSLALKIAVMPTLDCLPLYLMKDHQLYDTAQLDLRLKFFTAQMDCDTALLNRRVEGSISDLVRTERMKKRGLQLDYLTATNAYWQLYSNRKARLKHLNQLGDKMIAMTRFSATDYLTDLTLDTVKTLNNEIDALWLTEPQATKARILDNPMLRDSRDFRLSLGVLALRHAGVADKRRKMQLHAFAKAYNAACDSINQNGLQHYADLLRKYCKADDKTITALPKLRFQHITAPKPSDIRAAKSFE